MKEKYRYLGKNVILFSINGFIPKILVFFLVPIYTEYLTAEEYGLSDILITTIQLLLPVLTVDIQDAVMRFGMDVKYEKRDVFSTAVRIILGGSLVLAICLWGFGQFTGLKWEYLLFTGVLFTSNALFNSCSMFCRSMDKVSVFVTASSINSVVLFSLNLFLLVILEAGLGGYLLALAAGKLSAVLYMTIAGRLYPYLSFRKISVKTGKEMLAFSFPLMFSVIAWWVNGVSDRYIITWMEGLSASGIYAMAYTTPNILMVVQNIFSQAWSISAIREFDAEDKDGFVGSMYELMNMGMVLTASVLMAANEALSHILFAGEFIQAWKYVPPLLVSVIFNTMGLFIGSIFTCVRDTKTLAWSTVLGALVNTVCNVFLVYGMGVYGAAIATLAGYTVVFLIRRRLLNRHIRMREKQSRNKIVYGLILLQMFLAGYGNRFIGFQLVIFAMLLILYQEEGKRGAKVLWRKGKGGNG